MAYFIVCAVALVVSLMGMLWRRDMAQIRLRESRHKAIGQEMIWGEGGYRNFCTCSKCKSWTYLYGPCYHCGTKEP